MSQVLVKTGTNGPNVIYISQYGGYLRSWKKWKCMQPEGRKKTADIPMRPYIFSFKAVFFLRIILLLGLTMFVVSLTSIWEMCLFVRKMLLRLY